MSSSGTARAETLSLTVEDFIKATSEYHTKENLNEILNELKIRNDIIPTLYLKRIKTDKYYYTFCSPEASTAIVKSLLERKKEVQLTDKLFNFTNESITTTFQEINDKMKWGYKGKYRFFRTHNLRKYHASNIGLNTEYIDALQGRSKNQVHQTYIKTNPEKLKELYKKALPNIIINQEKTRETQIKEEIKEEINITINIFISDTSYNIY